MTGAAAARNNSVQTTEPPKVEPRLSDVEPTWEETQRILDRVDSSIAWAALVGRLAMYGVLLWVVFRSPQWLPFLTGFFVADVVLRIATGFAEFHERRAGLLLDVILFGVVGQFWSGAGGSLLPADPEGRGIAMLAFLLVFSVRGSHFVWKQLHPD